MNKKSWLIVGLSLAMAASIGVGISACGEKEPDTPPTPTEHTHTYDAWDHNDTQHWKYCDEHGTDKSNIDESTREGHIFTNGSCECGMKEADITPDEGRDTRNFWVVGSGAGDLSKCSFTELKPGFMLTKQPKKDENGYTVYTTAALTLYAGDTMKIVQDLDWDEGLGYFGVSNIKNNDGSLVDGGGPGNITPAVGKDGKYRFTVRTKPDIAFSECTLEFELIEPVEPLKNTEQIYIVGQLLYYKTQWPSGGSAAGCLKLNHDETTGEWSIVLRLGGSGELDEFKLYNSVNGKYYPDGTGNNWNVGIHVSGVVNYKESGDYKISWKPGDTDITFTLLPHEHNFDDNRMAHDENQHWAACWLDDTQKPDTTREDHIWENEEDTKCDKCGYVRHIHKYDTWDWNEEEHWKYCSVAHGLDKSNIDESTRARHTVDPETHTCECGYEEHTHEYTKWEHDAKQHWKVCPKDNEIDPDTPKALHSFDPVTHTCECGYEHTHTYTRYNYNDKEHWKECPTDDVIDETTRAAHVYDQEGNKCVCGAVDNGCAHDGGVEFEYTAAPEVAAEGGTLKGKCKQCGEEVDVPYNAALEAVTNNAAPYKLTADGSKVYFVQDSKGSSNTYVGLIVSEAGTYTVSFESVFLDDETTANLTEFYIHAGSYCTVPAGMFGAVIANGSWAMLMTDFETKMQGTIKVNGESVDTSKAWSDIGPETTFTFSFTVQADDLTGGDLYVTFNYHYQQNYSRPVSSVLVSCTKSAPAPAALVAPVEVAMLPEKKD